MKPTPVQARGLKALNAEWEKSYEQPDIYLWFKRDTEGVPEGIYEVGNHNLSGFRMSTSTTKVLLRNAWIEERDQSGYYIISQSGKDILDLLSDRDFVSKPTKKPIWSTRDILDALNEKYRTLSESGYDNAPVWIYFDEFAHVDFWAMACWNSLNHKRISHEIKISRGDFLHEIKNPHKKDFGMKISNEFYFVTPPGLIKEEELPEDCGLIELSEGGKLAIKVKAKYRNPDFVFTWPFAACLGRKTFKKYQLSKKESPNNDHIE